MKKYSWIIAIVLLVTLFVPNASAAGITNAPPENLNIVVLNDLNHLTDFETDFPLLEEVGTEPPCYTDTWGQPLLESVIAEGDNKLIRLENELGNFNVPGFMNGILSQPLADYAASNSPTSFYGVAMYVRTEEDYDVDFWQMGIYDNPIAGQPAPMNTGAYLYDMNGALYASHEDGDSIIESGTGVIIPYDFEGYLILTYAEGTDYSKMNYFVWWMLTEPTGALIIDNIGLCTAAPTEAAVPSQSPVPSTESSAAPSVEPSIEPSVEPSVGTTDEPFYTEDPIFTDDPNYTDEIIYTEIPVYTSDPVVSNDPAVSDEPADGENGPNIGLIIGIVAGVVVIAGAVAVFISIRKKKIAAENATKDAE